MIKIAIHPAFFFFFLLALTHGFIQEVMLLFFLVLAHELGHALTAKALGWRVLKIELLPFGGKAEVEEHGNRPDWEEWLVTIAGPVVNLLLIILAFLCLVGEIGQRSFWLLFIDYNLLLVLFNLMPIWPLDGGKAMQLILARFFPFKKAIRLCLGASLLGLLGYMLMVIIYFPYYLTLWIVAAFLWVAHWLEFKQAPYQFLRFLSSRYYQHQNNPKQGVLSVKLPATLSVRRALEQMFRHKYHYFLVLNRQGKTQTMISEEELLERYFKYHDSSRAVGDIFR